MKASDFRGKRAQTMGVGLIADGRPSPRKYLRHAEADLAENDSERSRTNALSNAKRALHLQVELLTDALGYQHWKDPGPEGFPRRLRFAKESGLITPRVLSKVNRLRNRVEHEYVDPDRETVADYVDIVTLYLEASARHVEAFPLHVESYAGAGENRMTLCIRTVRGSGVIKVYKTDSVTLLQAVLKSKKTKEAEDPYGGDPPGFAPVLVVSLEDDGDSYFEWAKVIICSPE